jgi:hypothetical protein
MRRLSDIIGADGVGGDERLTLNHGEEVTMELISFREREGTWGRYWVVELRHPGTGKVCYLTSGSRPFCRALELLRRHVPEGEVEPPILVTLKRLGRTLIIR